MKALVYEGPHRLELRELPRPQPGPGEVLVRVHWAAICGTDVKIVSGRKTRDVRVGHPIGHECAGTVAAVGEGVAGYQVGERVAVCVVVSCGECEQCRADHENLCAERITLGYHTDGAFAEYMLIPARAVRRGNVFKLPESVPLEVAPLIEPMACCINGQYEMKLGARGGQYSAGHAEALVIFGAGPIGLMHLLIARAGLPASGPASSTAVGPITVVEPAAHRRELAKAIGADFVCAPEELNGRESFDAAIVAVGAPDLLGVALASVRNRGKVNLFAGFPVGSIASIDPNQIHYKQVQVTGASESRRRDYAEALALVRDGLLNPALLISHRFNLEQFREAFDLATGGGALKIAFEMLPAGPGRSPIDLPR